jgi:hypothetical protein
MLIRLLNEPVVGTQRICNNTDHSAPFDILADIILERTYDYVLWTNRSGSKTYLFGGFVTWFKSCTKRLFDTKILAGSEHQALLSYQAISDFWRLTDLQDEYIKGDMLVSRALWQNGSRVGILPASKKSVRGPHPQNLLLDEVDEIDGDVYDSALSMPQSKYGHPAITAMFSTNHNIGGQMDVAIKQATEKGTKVYKYCVWECLESCKDYECSTCPLSSFCPGRQMKHADGYYLIEDFIKKLNQLSMDMLLRDWFCVKVGRGDLVYQNEWDETANLVNVPLDHNKPVVLSIDFGGADPFSVGVWQQAPTDYGPDAWVRVTEVYLNPLEKSATNQQLLKIARVAPWWGLVKEICPDPARADLIQEWKDAIPGVKVHSPERDIDIGVEQVKANMKPVIGSPRLYVNRSCASFRLEVMMYAVKDGKIIDKWNHSLDEARYFVMSKMKPQKKGYFGMINHDVSPE